MASVIQLLHEQAQGDDTALAEMMPRALFAARVLRQQPVVDWMRLESSGYEGDVSLPPYRKGVCGTLVAWMPGQGWAEAPVNVKEVHGLSCSDLYESLSDLEEQYKKNRSSGGIRVDLSEDRQSELQQATGIQTRLALAVPSMAHAQALEAVRIIIGHWAQDLLDVDVKGDGMTFSEDERAAAEGVADKLEGYFEEATEQAREHVKAQADKPGFFGRLFGRG